MWTRGVALAAVVAGCEPLPITAVPPGARWRPEPACRVRQRYRGHQSRADYEYQLAADGRAIEIRTDWSQGSRREVFIHDDHGTLLARETAGEAVSTTRDPIINAGPFRRRIDYRHDGKGRRTSAVHVDLGATDPQAVTVTKQVRYQYDGDRLVAIEWTARGNARAEAWRLSYEGPRLVQARHEVDGRVSFLHDYKYDSSGRRATALHVGVGESEPSRYEFRYDPAGRLIGKDWVFHGQPHPEQRLEYDAAGRVTRLVERWGEIHYTYDDTGRIVRIEHASADPVNRSVSELTYGDGCTAEITVGLIPDPVSDVLDDLGIGPELWFLVHPEWEWDTPWF